MWESSIWRPQGSVSLRRIFVLATALFVACFVYIIASAPLAHAADAEFNGDTLTYNSQQFSGPFTTDGTDPPNLARDVKYYTAIDPSDSTKATVIYFARGQIPKDTNTARVVTATANNSGKITALSTDDAKTISIATAASTTGSESKSSCQIEGIGWMACPLSKSIATGVDFLFKIISYFLQYEPLTTAGSSNSIYAMWNVVRSIANVAFVIAFLIIIYSEMTSSIFNSYTVKKILPRIVVAAVLVNISFWICAIFIDISNILGASIYDLFDNLKGALNIEFDAPLWQDLVANALAGTGIVVGGVALFSATVGGAGAFFWLIIAALIPVIFAALVAVAILAARQALITLFVIIAPLAFVAYLLPNTEEWFSRWRKLFTTMLLMYPAFALLFGASQVAGLIIMQNAKDFTGIVFGLTVQAIPLFITPFLIKLSSGVLGTIAGLANDKSKGVFDRTKNWANSHKELNRARAMRNGLTEGRRGNRFRPTTYGARAAMSKANREARTKAFMGQAQGLYDTNTGTGRRTALEANRAASEAEIAKHNNDELYQQYLTGMHNNAAQWARNKGPQWVQSAVNRTLDDGSTSLRDRTHHAHAAGVNAEILKSQLHEEGELHARDAIANAADNTYLGRIRQAQVDSVRDKGLAENAKKIVEAQGNLALKQAIADSTQRTQQVVLTQQFTKDAEQYDTIVQKAAEAAYDTRSRTNTQAQELRLRAVESTDQAKLAEQQWNTLIENIKAEGSATQGVGNANIADSIRTLHNSMEIQSRAENNAKVVQTNNLTDILLNNAQQRQAAGGIRGDAGAETVLAAAVAQSRKEYGERVSEKTQLSRHFNLSSAQKQDLAMGADVTAVRDDGTHYTFKAADEYARESAIEDQLKAGSFGQIEQLIESAGVGGANYGYRTTIRDAIVSNGLPNKALYWGSKTIDDVGQGLYDASAKNAAILYHIVGGKISASKLATQSSTAAEAIFDVINDRDAIDALPAQERVNFDRYYQQLKHDAWKIMHDDQLQSVAEGGTQTILERFMEEPPVSTE